MLSIFCPSFCLAAGVVIGIDRVFELEILMMEMAARCSGGVFLTIFQATDYLGTTCFDFEAGTRYLRQLSLSSSLLHSLALQTSLALSFSPVFLTISGSSSHVEAVVHIFLCRCSWHEAREIRHCSLNVVNIYG